MKNNKSKPAFIDVKDFDHTKLADYFNLEYGITTGVADRKPFLSGDFKYLGVKIIDGTETVFWAVNGQDICATIQPYEGTYLISMAEWPDD